MTALITNTGEMWEADENLLNQWKISYQGVNVTSELNAMASWLMSNPTKRKTLRGMSRFCNAWLSRAQDKGGVGMGKPKRNGKAIPTRDMTSLDDLSHLFVDTPEMRDHFLNKFGQYFVNGERVTR